MYAGRMVEEGRPRGVRGPLHPYTRRSPQRSRRSATRPPGAPARAARRPARPPRPAVRLPVPPALRRREDRCRDADDAAVASRARTRAPRACRSGYDGRAAAAGSDAPARRRCSRSRDLRSTLPAATPRGRRRPRRRRRRPGGRPGRGARPGRGIGCGKTTLARTISAWSGPAAARSATTASRCATTTRRAPGVPPSRCSWCSRTRPARSTRARPSTRPSPRGCGCTGIAGRRGGAGRRGAVPGGAAPARALLPALPAPALGRSAPARRDRRRAGARAARCSSPTSRSRPSTPRCAARSSKLHAAACATRLGLARLVVTHDLGLAWNIADRVAVMYLGRIVELGPTEEMLESRSTRTRGRCCRSCPRRSR